MASPTADAGLTGVYDLDPAHTRVAFVTRHAMVTKVRSAFHDIAGQLNIDGQDPTKSNG